MKIVFMGTPDFAVPPLKALVEAGYDVAAVVTQPDKPKGRGKSLLPTPVKEEALLHEIPVYQPQRVKNNPDQKGAEQSQRHGGQGVLQVALCRYFNILSFPETYLLFHVFPSFI